MDIVPLENPPVPYELVVDFPSISIGSHDIHSLIHIQVTNLFIISITYKWNTDANPTAKTDKFKKANKAQNDLVWLCSVQSIEKYAWSSQRLKWSW